MKFIDQLKDRLRKRSPNEKIKYTRQSFEWFRKNIRTELGSGFSSSAYAEINRGKYFGSKVDRAVMGGMYFFRYDPKHKDTLPYYDKFPLILLFALDKEHFWGINLHYITPTQRGEILLKLYQINNISDEDMNKKRIKLSYQLLMALSKDKFVKHAVKCYLYTHVKSRFIRVHQDQWISSVYLPVEMFEKQGKHKVWRDI